MHATHAATIRQCKRGLSLVVVVHSLQAPRRWHPRCRPTPCATWQRPSRPYALSGGNGGRPRLSQRSQLGATIRRSSSSPAESMRRTRRWTWIRWAAPLSSHVIPIWAAQPSLVARWFLDRGNNSSRKKAPIPQSPVFLTFHVLRRQITHLLQRTFFEY